MRRSIFYFSLACLCLLLAFTNASAQIESGTMNGTVADHGGARIAGAKVTLTDIGTNISKVTETSQDGTFHFAQLKPSRYKLNVTAPGFKESIVETIDLHPQDTLAEDITLEVGSTSEQVSVNAQTEQLDTTSSISTTVDRKFIETMPLNGRSFQALIALTPGNVTAKTYYTNSGQFSVNGQRTDANYFSIDGVSANVGITQGSNVYLGTAGGGTAQATSNNGGYNNLVSVDDMQEYKIQTSTFDAEYGRTTGAQLAIVTRSGTNQFHGTVFEYLRNDVFDANNWFNNNEGLPRQAEKQNDFGFVVGGPILRDKLFFFGSYEGLRLRVPESRQDVVPTTFARQNASAAVAPLLSAYALPSAGQDIQGNYTGIYYAAFSNPSTLNATSVRLDYTPTPKLNLFVRGNYAPSDGEQYGAFDFYTRSTLSHTISNVDTITAGATYVITPSLVDDFRFNISHSKGATVVSATNLGGATPPSDSYLFQSQPQYSTSNAVFGVFFNDGTSDYYVGNDATNHQRQLNFVDTLSWNLGHHSLKFGGDYRRLTPKNGYRPYDLFYTFQDVQTLVTSQIPVNVSIDSAETTDLRPIFNNVSLFAQDAWQMTPRLTLNYGLRWDIDPPPTDAGGHPLFTAINLEDPANVALAPSGTPLWHESKTNFAPRVGVAYLARQVAGFETMLRAGAGIYYGLGNEIGAQGTLGAPYTTTKTLLGADGTYPLTQAQATPLPISTDPPYSYVFAFDPHLKDPRVIMWDVAVQQSLGDSRSVQIGYVGNKGDNLLRSELLQPTEGGNANFAYLTAYFNHDYSNYNSLQLQFKQNMWHHVQALFSYTWSHALDNGSSLALPHPYHTVYDPHLDYGNSDLDVRNSFSNAITYELPGLSHGNGYAKYATNGWALDSLFRSNSSQPIDINTGNLGAFGMIWSNDAVNQRPNVTGKPFWKPDPSQPGGKVIDATAFSTMNLGNNTQGDLQRNTVRGFGAWQEDIALRRTFPIHDTLSLQFRAEAFNIFNHPLFGDPGTNDNDRNSLTNQYFGISAHSLADSLGGGGADGGFSSLYQIGSPRSMQFALKLQF
ncbi:carboxypeptidase regulatory-like domain-containing protein [Silvibacterium acidisoli]|uniref:carboxypeptidase regulatory-like domain-containing protein n=1 Tax=Acidobacteriaceae bacterium ZG23-2 TaxID=2883246 RepID=UPI00406CB402